MTRFTQSTWHSDERRPIAARSTLRSSPVRYWSAIPRQPTDHQNEPNTSQNLTWAGSTARPDSAS